MRAPTIVIIGQARAGITLLHTMLREGGIPDAPALRLACEGDAPGPGLVIAPAPHANAYHRPRPCLGLFIQRSTGGILTSIARHNEGRPPLERFERIIVSRDISHEFLIARDAAAAAFAPVVMFMFDDIIADPHHHALRLYRLVAPWWPDFDARKAALSVRRIKYVPRLICLKARVLSEVIVTPNPGAT